MHRVLLRTSASRTASSARTRRCLSEVRCARRYAPSRHASANVRASRRSVFTRLLRVAYIAATVRISHDHLVPELLQAPRHPLALRRCLDQHPRLRSLPQHRPESLPIRVDPPLLDHFPVLAHDAHLAVHLVHVDAYTLHGWPPSPCGFDRPFELWSFPATTLEQGPAASSHLSSCRRLIATLCGRF